MSGTDTSPADSPLVPSTFEVMSSVLVGIVASRLWTWVEDISLLYHMNKKKAQLYYKIGETRYRIHTGFENQIIMTSILLFILVVGFIFMTIALFDTTKIWPVWLVTLILVISELTFLILFATHKRYSFNTKTKILITHMILKPITFWALFITVFVIESSEDSSSQIQPILA